MSIRLTIPTIDDDEISKVAEVLRSGYLVQGKYVQKFEQLVAEYLGIKYAIAVSSGTAALHLALLILDIGPVDEVIIPDFTFPATANVVSLTKALAVPVDIDLETFNIDIGKIESLISKRTKAIMPVHLFGNPADMNPILQIADKYNLSVIEDAACALGAKYYEKKCGTIGNIGCFSFHPRKIITTGEGGMIVTNDAILANKARRLRNHGVRRVAGQNVFEMVGYNYRMTDFQGALGMIQMKRLEEIIGRRIELANLYNNKFEGISSIGCPKRKKEMRHTWQSYVILLNKKIDRNAFMAHLKTSGIETAIGTYAVSCQPCYNKKNRVLPNSLFAYKQGVCLPLYPKMTVEDIAEVVRYVKAFIPR